MNVVVGYAPEFAAHPVDAKHPERPARSDAAWAGAVALGERVGRYDIRRATRAEIERIHHAPYIDELEASATDAEPLVFDADTVASSPTYDAALLAAGSAIGAVDAVFGEAKRAFSLARPPGHHAEVDRALGFCFFNNIAIAAQHAITAHGCRRVAIVDWDVHHGNGTQRSFEARSDVLFVSSHQYKLFPGSGHYSETGRSRGKGFTVNLPLGYEATDDDLLHLHGRITVPILEAFAPDLLLISAGFDAHAADRTADQRITAHGFGRLAALLFDVADRVCAGRTVLVLEGGYDLDALRESVTAVLEAAIDPAPWLAEPLAPAGAVQASLLDALVEHHTAAWPRLRR